MSRTIRNQRGSPDAIPERASPSTPEQRKEAEKLDDIRIAADAFQLCGAYVVAATDAVKARNEA